MLGMGTERRGFLPGGGVRQERRDAAPGEATRELGIIAIEREGIGGVMGCRRVGIGGLLVVRALVERLGRGSAVGVSSFRRWHRAFPSVAAASSGLSLDRSG